MLGSAMAASKAVGVSRGVPTRIPQMDWRSASLVHQFPLVGQDLTPDQVAGS